MSEEYEVHPLRQWMDDQNTDVTAFAEKLGVDRSLIYMWCTPCAPNRKPIPPAWCAKIEILTYGVIRADSLLSSDPKVDWNAFVKARFDRGELDDLDMA